MRIKDLALSNFRNYKRCAIDLSPTGNILFGPNASGKTNLLEAVIVLAVGRSPRATRDADMVCRGEQGFHVRGVIERGAATVVLEVGYDLSGAKVVRINGAEKKSSALLGQLNVVGFFPDDVFVVNGPPALRRRLLDNMISQNNPGYHFRLIQYQRILTHRNSLLKQCAGRPPADRLMDPWDVQLCAAGTFIVQRRIDAVKVLYSEAASVYERLAAGEKGVGEKLEIRYMPSIPFTAEGGAESGELIASSMISSLKAARAEDARLGATTVGPHRDDILLSIDGKDARLFASQGQQRSVMLAIKSAEAKYHEGRVGELPVMLLDDVFSELDNLRQAAVLREMGGYRQTIITCTDVREAGDLVTQSKLFSVREGRVEPVDAAEGHTGRSD